MKERERTKPAQFTLPSVLYKQLLVSECIWAIVAVPVFICYAAFFIRTLIVLHKAPLPNFFVCEGTEKERSAFFCDLCVYGFTWL